MVAFDGKLTSTIAHVRRHALGDLLWRSAARTPDKTALVYRDVRQSYAQLNEVVNRTANALAARGVRKGERIALLSHNNHAYVVACFALARLGAICVPVNFMLGPAEVAYIVDHAEVSGVIVEDALLHVAVEALAATDHVGTPTVRAVIGGGVHADPPQGWEAFEGWLEYGDASVPDVPVDDDDAVQLIYTSGTESRPKGVLMSSRSLVAQYVSCIVNGKYRDTDIEVHALPLFHVAAQHCFLMPSLYIGATNIVLDSADPATILATVERERITKMFCPPTVWIGLLQHADFDRRDLSSLRKGYYGASIMPVEIIKEISSRLPEVELFNFYGQTEMSAVALVLSPEDQLRKPGSAGRPAINVETALVDDHEQHVPPGVEGEIVHRSPHATIGYWRDPEKTAEAFQHGWFHSGDIGVMDEDGYISVVDRKKDMIKTGGENVASREVEEVIYQHPDVVEVAVFGIPHPRWVEAVTAVIVPRTGASLDSAQLIGFCREHLASYKTPKYVVFVGDLPKTATGKILKRDLRAAYTHLAD